MTGLILERLPVRVTNIEGDFQATRQRLRVDQNGFAPIQWRCMENYLDLEYSSRSSRMVGDLGRRSAWGRDGRGMRCVVN